MTTDQIILVPVAQLVPAPENARKTHTDAGHEQIKASILAEGGLLQNLIAYETDKGKFAVVAGERRRKALAALIKEKKLPKTYAAPCLVRPREEALALSLAENAVREEMHPADAFEAFAALVGQGKSIEDVAARYGVTPSVVTRRLKLGRVAPKVMAAYREDKLSLEAVMAFTVSNDHDEQEQVLADLMGRSGGVERHMVMRMLTHEKVSTSDERFRFIGEEAYCAAGGSISRDLFDTKLTGYADDSALLDRLTVEKLALKAPALFSQGWKWIEPIAELTYEMRRGFARIHPRTVPLSAKDRARKAEIEDRLEEIAEETGHSEPEDGVLAEEYQRLLGESEEIEGRSYAYEPAEMALAGGWLTLDDEGRPDLELGYVKAEDIAALEALRQAAQLHQTPRHDANDWEGEMEGLGEGEEQEDEEAEREPHAAATVGLSDALLSDLHAARTVALRLELAGRPDIALRLLAHGLAGQVITHTRTAGRVTVGQTHIPAIAQAHCPSDEPLKQRLGHWQLRLPGRAGEVWAAILALSDADLLDLIAVCVAVSIDATHAKHPEHHDRQRMAHADQLAATLALDMTKHWTPTAESFFGRVSKAVIADAVTEASGPSTAAKLAKLKKIPMATEAEKAIAGTGWLPMPLRTKVLKEVPAPLAAEA